MGVLQQGEHFGSHFMASSGYLLNCAQSCPAAHSTDVSSDYSNHGFDATKQNGILRLVHFHGKEATVVGSALPGIVKFGITAAKLCHAEEQLQP